jgi:hypothetical protein
VEVEVLRSVGVFTFYSWKVVRDGVGLSTAQDKKKCVRKESPIRMAWW